MAKSGTPAQQFKETHEKFLQFWANGLHPLEIGRKLGSGLINCQKGKKFLLSA